MSGAVNPWRGERELRLPGGEPVILSVTLDHIARVMSVTGVETLDAMNAALAARKPAVIEAALAQVLGDVAASEVMSRVNGVAGLTAVYSALVGALSGLTPEEEDDAKKTAADREKVAQAVMMRLLADAVGQSSGSPSETG